MYVANSKFPKAKSLLQSMLQYPQLKPHSRLILMQQLYQV